MLDNTGLKDLLSKMVTPAARREAVAHLEQGYEMSERRACRIIDADRKSVRYRSTRDDDAALREKLRELANQRRRFGYRRIGVLLERKGTRALAEAYLNYLYSEEGQRIAAKNFYRPRNEAVAAEFKDQFPALKLVTIDGDFGGWKAAQPKFFNDGGIFDQIYQAE